MGAPNLIKNYAGWLQDNIHSVLNEGSYTYPLTLVEYKRCKNQNYIKLVVQVTGKNIYRLFEPYEIYQNPNFLSCFSPLDASRITELALLETAKQSYAKEEKRSLKLIQSKVETSSLVFKDELNDCEVERSINSVINDETFRDKILPQDLFKVGYLCGMSFIKGIKSKISTWRDKQCKK